MLHSQHKVPPSIPTSTNVMMPPAVQQRQNDRYRSFDPTIAPPAHHLGMEKYH